MPRHYFRLGCGRICRTPFGGAAGFFAIFRARQERILRPSNSGRFGTCQQRIAATALHPRSLVAGCCHGAGPPTRSSLRSRQQSTHPASLRESGGQRVLHPVPRPMFSNHRRAIVRYPRRRKSNRLLHGRDRCVLSETDCLQHVRMSIEHNNGPGVTSTFNRIDGEYGDGALFGSARSCAWSGKVQKIEDRRGGVRPSRRSWLQEAAAEAAIGRSGPSANGGNGRPSSREGPIRAPCGSCRRRSRLLPSMPGQQSAPVRQSAVRRSWVGQPSAGNPIRSCS